jgi:ricin-type beta-trefoil lectin protein
MPNIRNIKSASHQLLIGVDPDWISAPLGAPFQALTNDNTSKLWWYTEDVPGKAGYFWLHNAETADVIGINPHGGIRSGSKLQSQIQTNEDSQYWTTVVNADKPGYFWLQSAAGKFFIDIDTAGGITSGSQLQVLDKKSEDNQYWSWAEVPLVAAPGVRNGQTGLTSSNNYFLFGGYHDATGFIPLNEVVVTITITEDLIGTPQFSFQLNCWSPKPTRQERRTDGGNYDVWQQYGLSGSPNLGNQVRSFAENWPQNDPSLSQGLFYITPAGFWTIENNGTKIPAGTVITIILSQLSGDTGSISGSLVVVGNASNAASQEIRLIGQQLAGNLGAITSTDLAPIAALQMNIVAWGTPSGQPSPTTNFTSGKGTIQYFSTTPMTVINGPPADVAVPNIITGEKSNCSYGALPQGTSELFVQTFGH